MSQQLRSQPKSKKSITIGVIDDHILFRKGMISLLEEYPEIKVVLEAGDGIELLEKLKVKQPDVLLLDIEMPNMNGIEATEAVRKKYSEIKILPLTMHNEEEFVIHLMEKGASGFLLKDFGIETIVDAIYSAHETGYYFNDKVSKTMIKNLMRGKVVKPMFNKHVLDEREVEVVKLICKELNSKEIGDKLCISVRTIEGIREKILTKTGAKNIAGIVMYAMKNNLIE